MKKELTYKQFKLLCGDELTHKINADGRHQVGIKSKTSFIIKGEGNTEEEAWRDAYDWVMRKGRHEEK
jgi:hypothetical protein